MGCGASSKGGKYQSAQAPNKVKHAPPAKIRAIRSAFQAIDLDGTGTIDTLELEKVLSTLEARGQSWAAADKGALFDFIDADKSGTIQWVEFVNWVLDSEDQETKDASLAKWAAHAGMTDLHKAAMNGDVDAVKECLKLGSNVNVGTVLGVTPLHFAARCGHIDAARTLVDAKANINLQTKDLGRVPLHAAAETGSVSIIELLVGAGTNVNIKNNLDQTPLHLATSSKHDGPQHVSVLLGLGADVSAKTLSGRTPLHTAARAGAGDNVEVILAAKADVNVHNTEYGNTPLHAAAGSGSAKATTLLLSAGAQVNAKDREEMTPLHWAVRGCKKETTAILLKAGADINAKTSTGYTPFGMSEEWCSGEISDMLADAGGKRS